MVSHWWLTWHNVSMKDNTLELIDIGANLTASSFGKDLSEVIERARQQSVSHIVVTGTNLQHSELALELCERWPGYLYATAGVHPHHAKEWDDRLAGRIHDISRLDAVKAIGECGLDFNRNFSSPRDQLRCFEAQLEIAADIQLPVFLHQRDAHEDFVKIIGRWRDKLSGGVAHCFTGNREEAKAYLDLDLYIGVTGWLCDERRGHSLQQAVADIPLDHLMIETDAPYLLPRNLTESLKQSLRDKRRNEPMLLPHVCQTLADYKKLELQQVAEETSKTAKQFFAIEG